MNDSPTAQATGVEARRLLGELAPFARGPAAVESFIKAFLPRVVEGMNAIGGVVWHHVDGRWIVFSRRMRQEPSGWDETQSTEPRHACVLNQVRQDGRPTFITAEFAGGDGEEVAAEGPVQRYIAPLCRGNDAAGLIEIWQPMDFPASAEGGGQVQLLMEYCELAQQCLAAQHHDRPQRREAIWDKFLDYNRRIHQSLNIRQTALHVANEGRLVVGCERLSVVAGQRGRSKVLAISGQEHIDSRAAAVRALQDLAACVMRAGEPLAYSGSAEGLAPQVAEKLLVYLDESPVRCLVVVPLASPQFEETRPPQAPIGVLIAEQSTAAGDVAALSEATTWIAESAAAALGNALHHEGLFLLPVWRMLGRLSLLVRSRAIFKLLAVLAVLAAIGAALAVIPGELKLSAQGVLQPARRREVFARVDGEVREVHVEHGATVRQGDLLLSLRNLDLDVQREKLDGQRASAVEHLNALDVAIRSRNREMTELERTQLHGERLVEKETIASLDRELELLDEKIEQLRIRAPIDGEIVTWSVTEKLMGRPVKRGESLLSVFDPTGDWELEVRMPESRMGHVAQARLGQPRPLAVTFVAANQPDQSLAGKLVDAQGRAEMRDEDGNTVLLRVAIDRTQIRDLRPGAEVTARVHCGRRPVAYVWFHEVLEFLQSRVLFHLQ